NYINKHGLIVASKDEVAPGAQHAKGNDQWDTLKQYMLWDCKDYDDVRRGMGMLHGSLASTSDFREKKKELYLLVVGYLRCKYFTKSADIVDKCLEAKIYFECVNLVIRGSFSRPMRNKESASWDLWHNRPMRNKESASWDLWHKHMRCWGEGLGTVPVGWSAQEKSVKHNVENVIMQSNALRAHNSCWKDKASKLLKVTAVVVLWGWTAGLLYRFQLIFYCCIALGLDCFELRELGSQHEAECRHLLEELRIDKDIPSNPYNIINLAHGNAHNPSWTGVSSKHLGGISGPSGTVLSLILLRLEEL
nr:mitochondrial fission 1 protein A-like [Tanacetum cinerariifolium]